MNPPAAKRFSSITMFFLGGLFAGVGVYFFSGDWACTAISAALFGAFFTPFVDWALPRLLDWQSGIYGQSSRWGRTHQLTLLVAATAALTLCLRLRFQRAGSDMFEEAMGVKPPATVTDIRAERYYAGGPGDMVCLIRFHTDRQTLEKVAAHRPLARVTNNLELYLKGEVDWPGFLQMELGFPAHFNPSWGAIPPMRQPESYEWFQHDAGPTRSVHILWDETTGEGYLIYSVG